MVLLHQSLVLLGHCKVQKPALTNHGAAQTRCRSILFFTLGKRAVIKAKLLAISDVFLRKHANTVKAIVLLDFGYSFTIRVATVTKSGCKVSK